MHIDFGAASFAGRCEQGFIGRIEAAIELAQIVEGQARCRQGLQGFASLFITQMCQRTEADAFVRNRPQLLLDLFQRSAQLSHRRQSRREHTGEPTDGAGQVDVVEEVFATVALKQDQRVVSTGPAHHHSRQRRQ